MFGVDLDSDGKTTSVTVTASSPGLKSSTLEIKVVSGDKGTWWCPGYQEL